MSKLVYAALGLALLLVFAMPIAVAEDSVIAGADNAVTAEAGDDLSADAGTTPDKAMYGWKLGWEKVGLWFTFKQEKKAEKELALARKRLLEVKKMAEKGNIEAMEKAQAKHDELVASAQARLASIQEDSTEAKVKDSMKKVSGLERAIEAHENRISVLSDILAEKNLSDEARAAIEAAVAKMQEKTEVMKQKLEERRANIKTRLKAVTEKNDSEIDEDIAEIDEETGLNDAKKAIAEKRIARAEQAIAKLNERIASGQLKNFNGTNVQARMTEREQAITEAKTFLAAGDYDSAIEVIKPVNNYGRMISAEVKVRNEIRQEIAEKLKNAAGTIKNKVTAAVSKIQQSEEPETE